MYVQVHDNNEDENIMRKWKKKLLMSESIRGLNLILEATLKRLKNLRIFPFCKNKTANVSQNSNRGLMNLRK